MSTFYVVHEDTGARESTYKSYKTHRGAKNFAQRLTTQRGYKFIPVSSGYYADVLSRKMTTVRNLMSGKEVEMRLVDVGGPCDPSTERYFSM